MAEADPASDSSAEALLEQQETTDERRETMPDEEAAKLDLVGLISRMEWRHVMDRVKNTPEETRRKKVISLEGHETKGYALHLVVSKKPPRHVVEAVLNGFPDAIKSREEKWGRLPLHIACIFTASAQVLKALLEAHEESLRITDKVQGRLPLHFACLYGSPFEISLLVDAEQRALVFKDGNGKTPMDLAQESSNPHRDAILRRLGNRTRIVTEAMIQRRKQQDDPLAMKRRSSGEGLSGSPPDGENDKGTRRSHSMSLGLASDEETVRKSNRSMSMGFMSMSSEKDDKKRGPKPGGSSQRRHKFRTVDDSDIGKKTSKGSKKRRESAKSSKNKSRAEESHLAEPNISKADHDVEKTPKLKNGRGSRILQEGDISDQFVSNEMQKKKRGNHLAMFLQATRDDSSGDDYEQDLKSMGAKSLPALMHSTFSKQKKIEQEENRRIAKSFMFDDSGDGDFLDKEGAQIDNKITHAGGPVENDSTASPRHSELAELEDRARNLDFRRKALSQECESIYETITKKEDAAHRSRGVVIDLQLQIAELQEMLEKEQAQLTLSETGLQLQKETLAVHEIKIKAVDMEKADLARQIEKLKDEMNSSAIDSD